MADIRRIDWVMDTAYQAMLDARAGKLKGMQRSIRRGWESGGGKKKAAKIALGIGFAAVFVSISIATAGVGTPVIAALAVGGFMVGQMSDLGFAKLSGRQYRGLHKNMDWVSRYRAANADEQSAGMELTQERAHKTIRRAFEHFRRAVRKSDEARQATLAAESEYTCDAAAAMVLASLHVSHHFDKARAYVFPALLLCHALLVHYGYYLAMWLDALPKLRGTVGDVLDAHQEECESETCFARGFAQFVGAPPHSVLWDKAKVETLAGALKDLDRKLDAAGFDPAEPAGTRADAAVRRTHHLYVNAAVRYHLDHKSVGVKVNHSLKNMWARKTSGERKVRVASTAFSAIMSAAGGSVGGGLHAAEIEPEAWAEVLKEAISQGLEHGGDEAIEHGFEDEDLTGPAVLEHHEESTRAAAETQTSLQKAAQHMYEIVKVVKQVEQLPPPGDCDEMVEHLRLCYKVEHHLFKTQKYLGDAVANTILLGQAIQHNVDAAKSANDKVHDLALDIVSQADHSGCGAICYGPHAADSFRAARPLS